MCLFIISMALVLSTSFISRCSVFVSSPVFRSVLVTVLHFIDWIQRRISEGSSLISSIVRPMYFVASLLTYVNNSLNTCSVLTLVTAFSSSCLLLIYALLLGLFNIVCAVTVALRSLNPGLISLTAWLILNPLLKYSSMQSLCRSFGCSIICDIFLVLGFFMCVFLSSLIYTFFLIAFNLVFIWISL